MKKLLTLATIFAAVSVGAVAQTEQTADDFVNEFNSFVKVVAADSTLTIQDKAAVDSLYNGYERQYDLKYKQQLTNKQKQSYQESRGKYKQYWIKVRTKNVTNTADSISNNISKKVETKVSEGVGFIKGLFKK